MKRILMPVLFILCVAQLPHFSAAAQPADATVPVVNLLDIRNFNADERLTALCLQGLANRSGPRVYLNTGPTVRWMQFDFDSNQDGRVWEKQAAEKLKKRYDSICDAWIDILSSRGLYTFKPISMPQLLREMKDQITGVILYEKVDDDLAIAATMAGLRGAVPMTPKVYEVWGKVQGLNLPVTSDVRSLYAQYNPNQERRLEAHRWAVKHLFPDCTKTGVLSRDRTYGQDAHDTLIDVDLAVQNRWMVYDLNYLSTETKNHEDKPHPKYGFELPDTALLKEILGGLRPFSPVYGWGQPDENNLVRRLTLEGNVLICTGTGNSSFYKQMPRITPNLMLPHRRVESVTVEDKVYVAFMVNEGDSLKYLASLGTFGCWLQPQRGKIPINWGMDPLLYREFPGLVSYFLATATPNDYFFAATSGWGYAHPERLSNERLESYAKLVQEGGRLSGLEYIDVWWDGGLRSRGAFFPFLKTTGMRGRTLWDDHQEIEYAPDGTPIIHSNHYYTLAEPDRFAEGLVKAMTAVRPPWFVIVYGAKGTGSPHKFYKVARRLPAERFKVVRLDELFEAARSARTLVGGRRWQPNQDVKTVAPGAGEAPVP